MVDRQASTIRERLAQRRRRRRRTRIALGVIAVLLVGLAWLYSSYIRSLGAGDPNEPIAILIGVVDGPARPVPELEEGQVPPGEGSSAEQPEASSVSPAEALAPSQTDALSAAQTDSELVSGEGEAVLQAAALVAIDPEGRGATVVSVPASTWLAGADGEAGAFVADAYARGGMDGLVEAAESLLGVPIHHHIQVDLMGFASLIDEVPGGVPVRVRSSIVYRDPEGEELFRLDPGEHVLDGQAALYYLRYRGGDWMGEVPRALRQRDFARALARTMLQDVQVQDLGRWLAAARRHVDTDLQVMQALRLVEMMWKSDPDRVTYMLLPGRAEQGRWIPDRDIVARVMGRTFRTETGL